MIIDFITDLSARIVQYARRLSLSDAILFLVTFSIAAGLKLFLMTSGPADLAWILSPTAFLVSAFTGLQFFFDPAKGYVNFENAVVIGTSCAGVNYFVIALCMTVFSFVPRFTRYKLPAFGLLILAAYGVTVMVNSFRIIGGIALLHAARHFQFIITDAVHQVEGIFVYFTFLALYYVLLHGLTHIKHTEIPDRERKAE